MVNRDLAIAATQPSECCEAATYLSLVANQCLTARCSSIAAPIYNLPNITHPPTKHHPLTYKALPSHLTSSTTSSNKHHPTTYQCPRAPTNQVSSAHQPSSPSNLASSTISSTRWHHPNFQESPFFHLPSSTPHLAHATLHLPSENTHAQSSSLVRFAAL